MELISEARKVWIPNHPTEAYLPGRVEEVREDGTLLVVDEDGAQFTVPAAEAQSVDPACLKGVDDLLQLGDFNEAALLQNVRVRYSEDKIYTGIGNPILISVNPYQNIPGLYSVERQREYRQAGGKVSNGGPPVHLYSVADAAFQTMLHDKVNQSIIISGESGAGKTEATKRMLAYLAEMQRSGQSGVDGDRRTVEQQVLDANPVLEAFGNAKTVRNDNSSRFGKFVEVEFDSSGKLLSAQISNYLLEKCRIVTQQPEERNYHIFYQVCAGLCHIPELAGKLQLGAVSDFEYIQTCERVNGVDDSADFLEVLDCMTSLGFDQEEKDSVLRIVAAVLHLGNLSFTRVQRDAQDGVSIEEEAQADLICNLLGIETQQLKSVLEHKTLEDPLTKKTIYRPHNLESASFTRHSMAKVVYTRLFDWLVWRINESISGSGGQRKELRRIGLLDIYGFEVFDCNSFEQLCINFANEKLQQHFNNHMFTLEQQMYNREGISWNHITFQDNQPIIDALARNPLGLFCLVDSECLMPSATDATLLGKIHNTFKTSGIIYKPSRFASNDFAVAHYAGEVIYNVETFLEKNTDKLHVDVVNLMKSSEIEVLKKLFTDPRFSPEFSQRETGDKSRRETARGKTRRTTTMEDKASDRQRQNVTVSMVFREQLERLVEDLNKTNPRYVRCIKPNPNKCPREFDSIDVLRQLRCAGMLESIRIRRAGYAVRRPFKDFYTRFRVLAPLISASGADPDYRALSQRLVMEVEARLRKKGTNLAEKVWQMGNSKIFMKEELEREFERLLVESAKHHVIEIQRRWRGYSQGRHFRAVKRLAAAAQATFRTIYAVTTYQEALRRIAAATAIQATLRSLAARATWTHQRRAAICMQRFLRGWRCRARIGKLRSKVAAEKIRKMREEEERQEALKSARREAEEKDKALEEMRRAMDETQRVALTPRPDPVALKEQADLREENSRLLQQLQASQAQAQQAAAVAVAPPAVDREAGRKMEELMEEISRLKGEKDNLKTDLEKATYEKLELQDRVEDTNKTLKVFQQKLTAADATKDKGGDALGALRSEILARIGDSPLAGALHSTAPQQGVSPAMQSALRPISDGSPLKGMNLSNANQFFDSRVSDVVGRKTNDCQREVFEELRKQWNQAAQSEQKNKEEGDGMAEHMQSNNEQIKQLEEEVRKVRRENAQLKTTLLSKEEETTEKGNEASSLLQQMSRLQAELQDLKYRHKGEVQNLRQQLEETADTLRQQTEDMKVIQKRALEAEAQHGRLDQTRMQAVMEGQDFQRERDRLQAELRARENELVNIKRVLDDVMSTHAPTEEVQKWKAKSDAYQRQYEQAMRYNKEMTSAVGQMTQAASERGVDWQDLQRRHAALSAEKERKDQQLKMSELEKEDLQKQVDNLQSSCTYFQNKYKATTNELKTAQKDHAASAEQLVKVRSQCSDLHRECEALKAKMAQANTWQHQHLNELQGRTKDQASALEVVKECIDALAGLHAEQLSIHDQVRGGLESAEQRKTLEEKRNKTGEVLNRLRTFASKAAASVATAGASVSAQAAQRSQPSASSSQHPVPSQPRQQMPSGAQSPPPQQQSSGGASLAQSPPQRQGSMVQSPRGQQTPQQQPVPQQQQQQPQQQQQRRHSGAGLGGSLIAQPTHQGPPPGGPPDHLPQQEMTFSGRASLMTQLHVSQRGRGW